MKSLTIFSFLIVSILSFGILPSEATAQSRIQSSNYFSYTYETQKEGIDIEARTEGAVELLFIRIFNGAGNLVFMNKFTIDGRESNIQIDLTGFPIGFYTLQAKSKSINFNDSFKKY